MSDVVVSNNLLSSYQAETFETWIAWLATYYFPSNEQTTHGRGGR
jgi:hypothetical protein